MTETEQAPRPASKRNYRDYTADHTYWTGRSTADGRIEVLRLEAGTYRLAETYDVYQHLGAAVGAAAQLAYLQGRKDAREELQARVLGALAGVGIVALPMIPDEDEDEVEVPGSAV